MIKELVIKTPLGDVKGTQTNNGGMFLGVPYAEKPIGNLQFKAPVKKNSWPDVLDCTHLPKDPIQHPMNPLTCSEDCLYLNIYIPSSVLAYGGSLPVMVWLYGGSYVHGGCSGSFKHGKDGLYDARKLAYEGNCIVVTVNYRLGAYGFLYLSEFSSDFESNLGLKDCEMALRWIQENISSYGGNPDNVTLWGQSAGGALTMAMMCVESAKDLFHKAIVQSACMESFYTKEQAKEVATEYLSRLGLTPDQVELIRTVDYMKLTRQIEGMDDYVRKTKFGICTINPVVDGEYLKEFPSLSKFEELGKPLLIGSNRDEAHVFAKVMKKIDGKECLKRIFPYKTEEYRNRVLERHSLKPKVVDYCDIAGEIMYHIPKVRVAKAISKQNPVYVYRFDYAPWLFRLKGFGACHVAEMPLLFDNMYPWFSMPLYFGDSTNASNIGKRMRHYWTNFAWTSNPNVGPKNEVSDLLEWLPYTEDNRNYMVFDKKDEAKVGVDDRLEEIFEGETHFFVTNNQ